jgi:type II secretory pathway pseudopilin PulG
MPDEPGDKSKEKIHGLSRNTWLVLGVVAGIGIYIWYRSRQAANAASSLANQTATVPTSDTTTGGAMSSTTSASTPTAFTDLRSWMSAVQQWSTRLGNDAGTTQNALQSYQLGNCLTAPQYAILDAALAYFGQPPDAPTGGLQLCSGTTGGTGTGNTVTVTGVPITIPTGGTDSQKFDYILAQWAVGLGNSPNVVGSAIDKWNRGQCMSAAEYDIISVGLSVLGGGPPGIGGPKLCSC